MSELEIPLFPLNAVLFPEGPLPLRIFETRYLDMVSDCLRQDRRFGVCLIRTGQEVGESASTHEIGTTAKIVDWHQRHDGLLGITARGEQRFRVLSSHVQPNHLHVAQVELLADEPATGLPDEYLPMADFLRQVIKQVPHLYPPGTLRYGDATWVGCRLAEVLPLPLSGKQYLLQIFEPIQRLERLGKLMQSLNVQY